MRRDARGRDDAQPDRVEAGCGRRLDEGGTAGVVDGQLREAQPVRDLRVSS
jgi:hypothetical protein